jgi:L-alanine-DL-glutamate epimerase-like enolase superfamily enzyme
MTLETLNVEADVFSSARRPLLAGSGTIKIVALDAVPFQLPVRREFKWAGLQEDLGKFVLVRIRTDSGLVGYGEATPLPDWGGDFGRRGGETQRTVIDMVEHVLGPVLIGTDPTDITRALALMDRVAVGHSYAKCAIDIALHDLLGKALGVPLYKVFGGACRDGVAVAHMVGLMSDADAIAEVAGALEDGISAFQIKGGVDPQRDVRLVTALRKEFGDAPMLRLDANQGYRDTKRAIGIIHALTDLGINYVEQPVEGLARMAAVTSAVAIPIVADETCWNAQDCLDIIAADAADCISIYLAKAAGLGGARALAAVARAAGMRCDVNGSIESGIGTAANVHFALAHPCVDMASVIPINAPAGTHPYRIGGNYYQDDIILEPLPVRDGMLLPIEGAGLGIEIDETKLERFRC